MRRVSRKASEFFGVSIGTDTEWIVLNERERATIRRAIAIREEMRERLDAEWGREAFEASDAYTLSVDDLDETGGVFWWKA